MKRLKMFFGALSIRKKIMALMLLGILSVGLVSFLVSFFTLKNILTQRICETNQSTIETMAGRIDEIFGNSTSAVVGISVDESIRGNLSGLYSPDTTQVVKAMNTLRTSLSNYTYTIVRIPASIALLTQDGRLIGNGDFYRQPDQATLAQVFEEYLGRFSFDSIAGQVPIKAYLQNPVSAAQNDYVYCIAMPMRSLDEQNTAIVMMLIHTRHMLDYLKAGDEGVHTRILTNAQGGIVLAADPALIGTQLQASPTSGGYQILRGGYLFRQKLANFDGFLYDWMDENYIKSQLFTVAKRLLLLDIAAVVLLILVARLIANSITRPIVRLSEKMAEQKYAALASGSHMTGGNEVRVLEYSFDVMQANIRQLVEQNRQKEQEKRSTEIKAL